MVTPALEGLAREVEGRATDAERAAATSGRVASAMAPLKPSVDAFTRGAEDVVERDAAASNDHRGVGGADAGRCSRP
jgi:hypothetical protein